MKRIKMGWTDGRFRHGKWKDAMWHRLDDQTSITVRQVLLDNIAVGLGLATIQVAMTDDPR